MDLHGREVYVGKNLIAHYGCYACHAIPGFEDAKPIGTELTEEGSKAVHRLDFGFVHLPHTRQDWFRTKLRTPARLRPRPRARLGGEAADAELPLLASGSSTRPSRPSSGSSSSTPRPSVVKELNPREAAIERGRRRQGPQLPGLPRDRGHSAARSARWSPTSSLAPPIIQGEGAKVQSDWLFAFLRAPKTGQIRPWLEVHMPTFGFSDRGAERPDALLRLSRPLGLSRSWCRTTSTNPVELGGGQEGLRAAQVRAVPSALDRGHEPARRRPRVARAESPDGRRRACATTGSPTGSAVPTSGCRGRACPRTSRRATTATARRR